MKREIWEVVEFNSIRMPNWPCPKCNIGKLQFEEKGIAKQNSDSRNEDQVYLSQFPEKDLMHYATVLVCSNSICKEAVAMCGIKSHRYLSGDYFGKMVECMIPKFFYPNLRLFEIAASCPREVEKHLDRSFSHYYNDYLASANALRSAIEALLTDKGIRQSEIKKGRRRRLSLAERIILLNIDTGLKSYLNAARWITNTGSHGGKMDRSDVLDGYEFIEHLIDEIYCKQARLKLLTGKAKKINDRKGPLRKVKLK